MPLALALAIALGGAAGSLARWGITLRLQEAALRLPAGTLVVNVLGSFLLGLVLALLPDRAGAGRLWRAALGVGFCGGFTTFSAFGADVIALVQAEAPARAALYAALSVGLGIAAVAAGLAVGRLVAPPR